MSPNLLTRSSDNDDDIIVLDAEDDDDCDANDVGNDEPSCSKSAEKVISMSKIKKDMCDTDFVSKMERLGISNRAPRDYDKELEELSKMELDMSDLHSLLAPTEIRQQQRKFRTNNYLREFEDAQTNNWYIDVHSFNFSEKELADNADEIELPSMRSGRSKCYEPVSSPIQIADAEIPSTSSMEIDNAHVDETTEITGQETLKEVEIELSKHLKKRREKAKASVTLRTDKNTAEQVYFHTCTPELNQLRMQSVPLVVPKQRDKAASSEAKKLKLDPALRPINAKKHISTSVSSQSKDKGIGDKQKQKPAKPVAIPDEFQMALDSGNAVKGKLPKPIIKDRKKDDVATSKIPSRKPSSSTGGKDSGNSIFDTLLGSMESTSKQRDKDKINIQDPMAQMEKRKVAFEKYSHLSTAPNPAAQNRMIKVSTTSAKDRPASTKTRCIEDAALGSPIMKSPQSHSTSAPEAAAEDCAVAVAPVHSEPPPADVAPSVDSDERATPKTASTAPNPPADHTILAVAKTNAELLREVGKIIASRQTSNDSEGSASLQAVDQRTNRVDISATSISEEIAAGGVSEHADAQMEEINVAELQGILALCHSRRSTNDDNPLPISSGSDDIPLQAVNDAIEIIAPTQSDKELTRVLTPVSDATDEDRMLIDEEDDFITNNIKITHTRIDDSEKRVPISDNESVSESASEVVPMEVHTSRSIDENRTPETSTNSSVLDQQPPSSSVRTSPPQCSWMPNLDKAGAVLKDVLMAEFSDETGCDEYLDDYEVEKMLDEQLMTESITAKRAPRPSRFDEDSSFVFGHRPMSERSNIRKNPSAARVTSKPNYKDLHKYRFIQVEGPTEIARLHDFWMKENMRKHISQSALVWEPIDVQKYKNHQHYPANELFITATSQRNYHKTIISAQEKLYHGRQVPMYASNTAAFDYPFGTTDGVAFPIFQPFDGIDITDDQQIELSDVLNQLGCQSHYSFHTAEKLLANESSMKKRAKRMVAMSDAAYDEECRRGGRFTNRIGYARVAGDDTSIETVRRIDSMNMAQERADMERMASIEGVNLDAIEASTSSGTCKGRSMFEQIDFHKFDMYSLKVDSSKGMRENLKDYLADWVTVSRNLYIGAIKRQDFLCKMVNCFNGKIHDHLVEVEGQMKGGDRSRATEMMNDMVQGAVAASFNYQFPSDRPWVVSEEFETAAIQREAAVRCLLESKKVISLKKVEDLCKLQEFEVCYWPLIWATLSSQFRKFPSLSDLPLQKEFDICFRALARIENRPTYSIKMREKLEEMEQERRERERQEEERVRQQREREREQAWRYRRQQQQHQQQYHFRPMFPVQQQNYTAMPNTYNYHGGGHQYWDRNRRY